MKSKKPNNLSVAFERKRLSLKEKRVSNKTKNRKIGGKVRKRGFEGAYHGGWLRRQDH